MSSSRRRATSVLVVFLAWTGCSHSQTGLRGDANSELRTNSDCRSPVEVEKHADTKEPEQVDPGLVESVDRDGDGVAEGLDQCPQAIELYNGVDDDDGCPDTGPHGIRLNRNGTMLLREERIHYAINKSDVHAQSLQQIAALSQVIKQNPLLGVIRIEVHTERFGSNQFNLERSQRRADEVRDLLLQAGVAGERLKAVGMGEHSPIASEAPAKTRAMSRRTEFWVEGPNSRGPR